MLHINKVVQNTDKSVIKKLISAESVHIMDIRYRYNTIKISVLAYHKCAYY